MKRAGWKLTVASILICGIVIWIVANQKAAHRQSEQSDDTYRPGMIAEQASGEDRSAGLPNTLSERNTQQKEEKADLEVSAIVPEMPKGMVTDLTLGEVREAASALAAERRRWSTLKALTGDVSIVFEYPSDTSRNKTVSGVVSVTRIDLPKGETFRGAPWKYETVLENASEGWKFRSDGSSSNTEFQCDQQSKYYCLKDMKWPYVAALLTMPRDVLVPLYGDELYNGTQMTLDGIVLQWTPWSGAEYGAPNSYIFRQALTPNGTALSLRDGRLHSITKPVPGKPDCGYIMKFEAYPMPETAGALSYPNGISMTAPDINIRLTFGKMIVNCQ